MIKWRRWNAAIHRDLGYLCAGLTLVYAVSGVAVNHTADWNPNYSVRSRVVTLEGLDPTASRSPGFARSVLDRLGVDGPARGTFRPDAETVQIFLADARTVTVDLTGGQASLEEVRDRPGLRMANFLHLNHARKLWTWMADLYAVALAVLAVTGLFVLRGRNGITGRGAWLTAAGVAIPALFLLLYF
ncbi:MAG: PepSY-associated TM helix domain-containing protein [Gemmatimonadota bacterium]